MARLSDRVLEQLDELSSEDVAGLRRVATELPSDERVALLRQLDLVEAFQSPAGWGRLATQDSADPYLVPPHIALLNRKLVELSTSKLFHSVSGDPCDRLMVTMPPQHGKSEICSKYLPAWFLTRFPSARLLLSSYEATYAASWGAAVRDLIEANPWCGIEVRQDHRSADDFWLSGWPGRMGTAGVGGPTTGRGAVGFVIDDPVKNDDEARSPVFRDRNWNWYLTTAQTRLRPIRPGHPIRPWRLVVMTRWHEDDLGGRLLQREGKLWEVINFPALAEEEDVLGRQIGDPLWPELHPREKLVLIRDSGREDVAARRAWGSLYQQHPHAEDGDIFKSENFRYWRSSEGGKVYVLPGTERPISVKDCVRVTTCDLAASTKTRADWTVFSTWDITRTNPSYLILVDRVRRRVPTTEHIPMLSEVLARLKPRLVYIEKKTFGLNLFEAAARRGLPVRPLHADQDKVSRAMQAADMVRDHRVFFPQGALWLDEWESELVAFDNSTHDDQVDTLAYAAQVVEDRRSWAPVRKVEDVEKPMAERMWDNLRKKRRGDGVHPVLGRGW